VTAANETTTELNAPFHVGAVLDDAHIGHIHGALGTIRHGDTAPRIGLRARWQTLVLFSNLHAGQITKPIMNFRLQAVLVVIGTGTLFKWTTVEPGLVAMNNAPVVIH
jgi:hypothetical protein